MSWNDISNFHFPHKTSNACRKRHERLMLRNRDANWDEKAQRQLLAREYMGVRKDMWSLLADRMQMGEDGGYVSGVGVKETDWKVVEKKCLEMGLRVLTREAKRAEKSGVEGEAARDGEADVEFEESDVEEHGHEKDSSEVVGSLHDSGIELQDEEADVPPKVVIKRESPITITIAPELPHVATSVTPSRAYGYLRNQPHLIESPAASTRYVLEPVVRHTETPLRTPSRKVTIASLLRSPSPSPEAVPRVERWPVVGGGFVRA